MRGIYRGSNWCICTHAPFVGTESEADISGSLVVDLWGRASRDGIDLGGQAAG